VLLVALLAICCCIAGVLGVLLVRNWNWAGMSFGEGRVEATQPFARTFDVREPVTLSLDAPVGDVTIKAGAERQVIITATKRAWGSNRSQAQEILDRVTVNAEQAGNQVRIHVSGLTGVNLGRSPQVDFVISVPEKTTLKVESKVGRLLIAETHGDVSVKADVGEVTLTDVLPGEELEVETRVASVEFTGALISNAHYRMTSDVGRIALRLPEDSAFRIDARSDIGDVRVDFTVAGRSSRGGIVSKEVRGEVGQNPTTELYLRSRIGEITVRSE
jgi:DUF4097 and DUF4098 domain-containing protein YvlB